MLKLFSDVYRRNNVRVYFGDRNEAMIPRKLQVANMTIPTSPATTPTQALAKSNRSMMGLSWPPAPRTNPRIV
jgi:hypothetical protein